eukprot:5104067-Alexandrium_andersonii.AAC.1
MEVRALTPDDSGGEGELGPRQVDAICALLKRFNKGKGEGGRPDSPAAPPNGGGGEGKGQGGEGFQG